NQWTEQNRTDVIYSDILKRVIRKRRHWKGKVVKIRSVETNYMTDMTFVFGEDGVSNHKCGTKRTEKSGDEMGRGRPNDPYFVLPVQIASSSRRSDGLVYRIKKIFVKKTHEKMMFKVDYLLDAKDHNRIRCRTWFEMNNKGHLRTSDHLTKQKGSKADPSESILGKIMVFGTPEQDSYLVPQALEEGGNTSDNSYEGF
ncbi:hypothetical protein GE061_008117, partial [Apolygus lucorum]